MERLTAKELGAKMHRASMLVEGLGVQHETMGQIALDYAEECVRESYIERVERARKSETDLHDLALLRMERALKKAQQP